LEGEEITNEKLKIKNEGGCPDVDRAERIG
jgi:hypothetical protein